MFRYNTQVSSKCDKEWGVFFDVLLTVHLSIVLVTYELNAQILVLQ